MDNITKARILLAVLPPVGQIDLHFAAEGAFRADGEDIAEDEHADHEHGIDRRPAERRVIAS